MTVGTCLASLLRDVCMQWTIEAHGPHGEDDEDRDHRPTDWNIHFFDFLGVLAVNLSNEQLVSMFLEPMSRFRDEPFYDAIGAFLRGFDRAAVATDTRDPENPAAVRSLVADRIRRGWGFKRLTREKSGRRKLIWAMRLTHYFRGHRTICSKLHAKPPEAGTRREHRVAAGTPPGV